MRCCVGLVASFTTLIVKRDSSARLLWERLHEQIEFP